MTVPKLLKIQSRSKRHLEIKLPEGASYRAGDYLALMPQNPPANVARVLQRFHLKNETSLIIHQAGNSQSTLPLGRTLTASEILANYVEVSQPAPRAQIQKLAEATPCPPEKFALLALPTNDEVYKTQVLEKRISVLDLLERYQSCGLSFATFLQMLPPLKPRQYSISSSPLWHADRCTLTVAVVEGSAWSGVGKFHGVASNFLAQTKAGDRVAIMPRASNQAFCLPQDPRSPIVLACAGTGIAPFRGFLQERALQKAQGLDVGEALLFFGCDHDEVDYLYRAELEAWEKQGVVRLHPAFSAKADSDVKYVQHRIWQDRQDVINFYNKGAKFYVCGDGRNMAPAIKSTFGKIYQEVSGASQEQMENWLTELERNTRYVADVFS